MEFIVGQTYSRRAISSELGGQLRHYLPFKNGVILYACFRVEPEYNPGAPQEVLLGEGPDVQHSAELMAKQTKPIRVFLFRESAAWEYRGFYRCCGYSTDQKLLKEKERLFPERGPIVGVLYFEQVS